MQLCGLALWENLKELPLLSSPLSFSWRTKRTAVATRSCSSRRFLFLDVKCFKGSNIRFATAKDSAAANGLDTQFRSFPVKAFRSFLAAISMILIQRLWLKFDHFDVKNQVCLQ
ncbi:hypothetical protein Ae201684P_009890 [Aphanomyces euteiches]|nr:hypothetical protein Ae201684P_009890 [Aphanomyces euteiches]